MKLGPDPRIFITCENVEVLYYAWVNYALTFCKCFKFLIFTSEHDSNGYVKKENIKLK